MVVGVEKIRGPVARLKCSRYKRNEEKYFELEAEMDMDSRRIAKP